MMMMMMMNIVIISHSQTLKVTTAALVATHEKLFLLKASGENSGKVSVRLNYSDAPEQLSLCNLCNYNVTVVKALLLQERGSLHAREIRGF